MKELLRSTRTKQNKTEQNKTKPIEYLLVQRTCCSDLLILLLGADVQHLVQLRYIIDYVPGLRRPKQERASRAT